MRRVVDLHAFVLRVADHEYTHPTGFEHLPASPDSLVQVHEIPRDRRRMAWVFLVHVAVGPPDGVAQFLDRLPLRCPYALPIAEHVPPQRTVVARVPEPQGRQLVDVRVVVRRDVGRTRHDQVRPGAATRPPEKVPRPYLSPRGRSRKRVLRVGSTHQRDLLLENLHYVARFLVWILLRLDRLRQPERRRLQNRRETTQEELSVCAVRARTLSYRPFQADQVVHVLFVEPVPDAVRYPRPIFLRDLRPLKLLPDGPGGPLQVLVPVPMGLNLGDQCGQGIDVASPEILSVPLRLDCGRAAAAEHVGHVAHGYAARLGVLQRFRCDERWELRRVGMNPVDQFLSAVAEVPRDHRGACASHPGLPPSPRSAEVPAVTAPPAIEPTPHLTLRRRSLSSLPKACRIHFCLACQPPKL